MPSSPTGEVTILFTDIVNSSRQWEDDAARMRLALAAHDAITAEVVASAGGSVFKHTGDGASCAFPEPSQAVEAATIIQERLRTGTWDHGERLALRAGMHTGRVDPTDGDYFGPVPNRASRIMQLAAGGQITCSAITAKALRPDQVRSNGIHDLRGIGATEIFSIVDDRLEPRTQSLHSSANPSHLPRRFTSFLGRDTDVAAIVRLINERGGVTTLAGPGGVGKTRLAIAVGETIHARFTGGVQFCDLAQVDDPDHVVESVADVVGARLQPGMDIESSVIDYLSGRNLLIVLDNCEHVLERVRALVMRLLPIRGVVILATSREPLAVPSEKVFSVAPLDTDGSGVELFIERARARDSSFSVDESNEAAIRQIVIELGGVPLAIELAAAWARAMTPEEILQRLRRHLGLLDGGDKFGPARSIRETVQWSMELLEPDESLLLTQLSVFAGGFDLEAAQIVCSSSGRVRSEDFPLLVMALVDKSMLQVDTSSSVSRFGMLETIRDFVELSLSEIDPASEIRLRHAKHYLKMAQTHSELIFGPAEGESWAKLDAEWGNIRKALDTFEQFGATDDSIDLVLALSWFSTFSMRFELFSWVGELLHLDQISTHPRFVDLCGARALGLYFTVDAGASAMARRGLEANPADRMGLCRTALSAIYLNNVHTPVESGMLTRAWLESGPSGTANKLWAESFRVFHLCSYEPGADPSGHAENVSAIARQTGSPTAIALGYWAAGQVAAIEDHTAAIELWKLGLDWTRSLPGNQLLEHLLLGLIVHYEVRSGDLRQVLELCRSSLQGAIRQHYVAGTSHLFGVTAIALCRAGDPVSGARLVGAMIANGHHPRANAVKALEDSLGDKLQGCLAAGRPLAISVAAVDGIKALTLAIEELELPAHRS